MTIQFDKYQGAGNDFVILDNRQGKYNGLTVVQIAFICDVIKGWSRRIDTDNSDSLPISDAYLF